MKKKLLYSIEECLDIEKNNLNLETKFKELPEWDSLSLLSFMVMLEDEFNVQINRHALDEINTVRDVLDFIESK